MQIENALMNDLLRVSKVSWKFCIPTSYDFAVIYPWNLLFSEKVVYLLTVSTGFFVYKQNFTGQLLKNNAKISVFAICVEAIKYFLYK